MVHAQWADIARCRRDGRERHQRAGLRAQVQQLESGGIALVFGQQLDNDPVLVVWRVDGRDLARTVRVVQRLFDLLDCHAQARCPIPIDAHAHLRILDLQIGGDILQVGQPPQCRFELRGVIVERVDVGALQCELILCLGRPAADADGCRNLEIGPNSRHIIELRGQLPDHLISGQPVAARLQPNAHTALVHRAPADRRHEMRHVRIAAQDVGDRELMVAHVLVGAALQRFRRALDLAGVFRGNESFGNQLEQHSGRDQNHPGEDEGEPPAVHHPSQRALVPRQRAPVHALRGVVKASVPLFLRRTEEAAAQHRRQRQRDESRDQDRDADRHGEFVEQAADDAAHEQDGNEHRGER